jgi:hypothetical protein
LERNGISYTVSGAISMGTVFWLWLPISQNGFGYVAGICGIID